MARTNNISNAAPVEDELKPVSLGASPEPVKAPTPPPTVSEPASSPAKRKYRVSLEGVPKTLEIETYHPAVAVDEFNKAMGIIRSDYKHVVEEV